MKPLAPIWLLCLPWPGLVAQEAERAVPPAAGLVGTWEGGIADGTRALRTVMHLALDAEGRLGGTIDSPDQNGFGFGLAEARFDGETLAFRVPETHGAWQGRLDPSSGRLVGTWSQRGAELALELERVEPDPLVGTWEGSADFGAIELRIRFHVGTRSDGRFGASLVSPDQSPGHVPVAEVEVGDEGLVRFEVPAIGARYEGRIDDGARSIEGHLWQGGGKFELRLEKRGTIAARRRPQLPEPPFPYRVEEVAYPNPAAQNRLAGTLCIPPGDGPHPAVLFVTGSGQQDRDEEIFGHRPFLVIADHLARAGIASLRVDDRGVGGSTGEVARATSADFATDVSAGLDFLRGRAEVRADRIGLVGHSEGGLIAPLVAVERGDVAFLVLLAGPGQRGDELLLLQAALLARAGGASEFTIALNRGMQKKLFAILHEEGDPAVARQRLEEVLVATLGKSAAQPQLEQVASPWFRFFVTHEPAPVLARVRCPVLALNGAKDLQVPAEENLAAIAAALEAGGNPDFETRSYPGLNHLFQPCETGAVREYGEIEVTIAPEVLADMTAWILARVGG